ncbi:MAG: hypothetical protein ACLVAT_13265 [Lachnospiraceae bacterium]
MVDVVKDGDIIPGKVVYVPQSQQTQGISSVSFHRQIWMKMKSSDLWKTLDIEVFFQGM